MGQKINPTIFRIRNGNATKYWLSNWYAEDSSYRDNLLQDFQLFSYFRKKKIDLMLSKASCERLANQTRVTLSSAKSGLIIGKKGENILNIQSEIKKNLNQSVNIDVKEIKKPNLDAGIISCMICEKIEKRFSYKKVIKTAIQDVMQSGASGVKISISGRLNGSEIARTETFRKGSTPLHKLRSEIDYAFFEAKTKYGIIGVKVWICVFDF